MAKNKHPKAAVLPVVVKKPKGAIFAENLPLGWRFSACDCGGRWPWTNLVGDDHHRVIKRLVEFERMTLAQIRDTHSHEVPIDGICKAAQDRLAEIRLDDLEYLFSLRITGRERVWCIRDINMMNVLWWDPLHEVWPVEKD